MISWCCGSEGLMSCWTLNGSHTWSKSISFPPDQPRKGFPQGSWGRSVYHMHFQIIAFSSVTWITKVPSMISTCGDQYQRTTLKSVGIYAHWNGRDQLVSTIRLFSFVVFPEAAWTGNWIGERRKNKVKWMFLLGAVTILLPIQSFSPVSAAL